MAIMGKLSTLSKVGLIALVALVLAAGMFFAGYHVGKDAGSGEGREAGYLSGLNEGYGLGLFEGYELGYGAGFEAGYWEVDGDIDRLIYRMGYAKTIHEQHLRVPPSPVTGSHEWHQGWIDTYAEAIAVLEQIEGH